MDQSDKAKRFASLHGRETPLVLYNAWDAGSAKAILAGGAKAVATSSWSVAEAQGYRDGEDLPFAFAQQIIERIVTSVDAPVTVDFEGGYSDDDTVLADNITRLLETGIIGINFEDRVVKGSGLYDIARQARRIATIRHAADKAGRVPLFINARTDIFFEHSKEPARYVGEALDRARAYADAGASGFFIPGLTDEVLIGTVCEGTSLPVNVMVMEGVPANGRLTTLGVARISYGPIPYIQAMAALREQAQNIHA
jgi:2-methylisocitrate lyase-like PEP mutase family enzyme